MTQQKREAWLRRQERRRQIRQFGRDSLAAILLLTLSGCHPKPVLFGSNWERICSRAPYRDPVSEESIQWLRQEGVVQGLHGWQVNAQWLNANCETVPGAHRIRR